MGFAAMIYWDLNQALFLTSSNKYRRHKVVTGCNMRFGYIALKNAKIPNFRPKNRLTKLNALREFYYL